MGRQICARLVQQGHSLTALSRNPEKAQALLPPALNCVQWGGSDNRWQQIVAEADAVIHLAGESVASQKWTPHYKEIIRSSRIQTTRALVEQMRQGVLISASAIGCYGDCGEEIVTEAHPYGSDFLAEVCRQWEAEAMQAENRGVRVALMRIGIVLGSKGGALPAMLHPLPIPFNPWLWGLGGPMGSGRQWFSWVHEADVTGLFCFALQHDLLRGPINVTSPNPVRNADFAHALGRALHRPSRLPLPAFALRALAGEFADTLLSGQRVLPEAALQAGYNFAFPLPDDALQNALSQN